MKGRQVHKSKTIYKDLNPFWDEKFVINIDDINVPLELKVRHIFIFNKVVKKDHWGQFYKSELRQHWNEFPFTYFRFTFVCSFFHRDKTL